MRCDDCYKTRECSAEHKKKMNEGINHLPECWAFDYDRKTYYHVPTLIKKLISMGVFDPNAECDRDDFQMITGEDLNELVAKSAVRFVTTNEGRSQEWRFVRPQEDP